MVRGRTELTQLSSAPKRAIERPMVVRLLVLAALLAACGGDDGTPAPQDAAAPVKVYVVRHAETGSTATDPSLDATGQARAQALATKLADAGIGAAFSSQYKRTQETAMPTAA